MVTEEFLITAEESEVRGVETGPAKAHFDGPLCSGSPMQPQLKDHFLLNIKCTLLHSVPSY